MKPTPPLVSIIVPVLNEAGLLGEFLKELRKLGAEVEIIIIDGGSTDGTKVIAKPLADHLLLAPRGRARQMNAGAQIARGEALWFLHADAEVPPNSIAAIRAALVDPRVAGGCFSLRYPRRAWIYRVSDSLGNIGVKIFGFALGDHGIFCRRSAFAAVGGYPVVPILEDGEFYRRLKGGGEMVQLPEKIVSDPRTFEKHGPYRTTLVYFLILALYVAGAPIPWLHRIYRWFHSTSFQPRIAMSVAVSSSRAPHPQDPRSQVALGNGC
jgi:rSAM/selenodomain-associated transferase 2